MASASTETQLIDEIALPAIASTLPADPDGAPNVVMLSSAGVTRPSWSATKQARLAKAFDIPIVRLNPAGILGKKVRAEKVLSRCTPNHAIVRPCGLNDDWPSGRPLLTQGDVAVGRTNRDDVAAVLVECLDLASARGKCFEMLTLKGYDAPDSLDDTLKNLKVKAPTKQAVDATYALLQQLLPKAVDPTKLEMGRTYEQVDAGDVDRQPGAPPTEREQQIAANAGATLVPKPADEVADAA